MYKLINKKNILIIIICLIMISLISCSSTQQKNENQDNDNIDVVAVEIYEINARDISVAKSFSGKLAAAKEVALVPKIPGEVKKVNVKVGQSVKKGQVLIELDSSDVDMQIKQAQAAYDAANANIQLTQKQLEQIKEQKSNIDKAINEIDNQIKNMDQISKQMITDLSSLLQQLETGQITQQEFQQKVAEYLQNNIPNEYKQYFEDISDGIEVDEISALIAELNTQGQISGMAETRQQLLSKKSELEMTSAELKSQLELAPIQQQALDAQLEQAQIGVDAAEDAKDDLKLKSPIDGIVASLTVQEGAMAVQSMPPVTVVDDSELILDINLTEYEINQVQQGQQVDVVIEALGNRTVSGIVDYVNPVLDLRTQAYPMRIKLDNADRMIKSGMFARVDIVVQQKNDCIAVPKSAILEEEGNVFVFIAQGDVSRKIQVETGVQDEQYVEIISGLKIGEKVITKGKDFLQDGSKINIVRGED